jgi:hypothetical protein
MLWSVTPFEPLDEPLRGDNQDESARQSR